ncbi:uncharacterized protein JCM15063_004572 [Sporobolomyces koalae]|uniref:uncharacterized protein n=1 Tax=Sporobolomyces koalae TaxID=500713 RepID=UPI003178030F
MEAYPSMSRYGSPRLTFAIPCGLVGVTPTSFQLTAGYIRPDDAQSRASGGTAAFDDLMDHFAKHRNDKVRAVVKEREQLGCSAK